MSDPFIAFCTYFLEMIVAYMFFSSITERKHAALVALGIGTLIFAGGAAANLLFGNNLLVNSAFMVGMHFLFAILCFRLKLPAIIFFTIILCALCAALEVVPIVLLSAFSGGHPGDLENNMMYFAFDFTVSKSLYFISSLLLSGAIKGKRIVGTPTKLSLNTILYPLVILVNLILFHYICMNEPISVRGQYLLGVISIGILVTTVFLVFASSRQAAQKDEYLRIQSELHRVKQEKTYYDILDKQNQQLMIYAHDTKNHLAAIRELSGDPQIHRYVEKLSSELVKYSRSCQSGNKLLDVILNRYALECEQQGLHFEYDVKIYNLRDIDDMDLVTILGNLMDNALEAAGKTREKRVSLETALRNGYRVLLIRNSSLPPREAGGSLLTSKADDRSHGFGLKSVQKTLKKYGGDLQWDYDAADGIFTMTVMIGSSE